MSPLRGGLPHCKRCGCELEGDEEACPRCGFNPRMKGLRVSMGLFMIVILSMTALTLLAPIWVGPAPFLIGLAAIAFVLSVVVFLLAFLATPYRLGGVFTRF